MSAIPKRRFTEAEYLAIERTAEFKSEYYNGQLFAMAGTSPQHNRIKENVIGEIFSQIKKSPCQSFSSDQRVLSVSNRHYFYPDIVIVCGTLEYAEQDKNTLVNPQVIFEVLSESTEEYDRTVKFESFSKLPSLKEFVFIRQKYPIVERFTKKDDRTWNFRMFSDLNESFSLTTIPVQVAMADIFRGVEFPKVEDPAPESQSNQR
jgi:Uma2 family endonuclease